jgi:hypothetical protein
MIDVQYSENVSILQLSDTAFVLKINDAKVYHFYWHTVSENWAGEKWFKLLNHF